LAAKNLISKKIALQLDEPAMSRWERSCSWLSGMGLEKGN